MVEDDHWADFLILIREIAEVILQIIVALSAGFLI